MRSPEDMRIIQIDVTNACVHTCSNCSRMCGHHAHPFFMDFDTFKKAVDSLEGFDGTIGIMGGEPTLHPEFERFTKYLASKYPKKETSYLIEPTDNFIRNLKFEEQTVTEKYYEKAGDNARVTGPGLWSSLISKYGDYYELIQDSFMYQCVNDHTISCYHQPVMVCRKDLGIPDDEWIKKRDNCWMQMNWSASITPKGAFFCEVAAALDTLFDGPGGWPIEPGWWHRTPDEFGDQLNWCEWCGLALETRSRDANEGIDDVSESFFERLKKVGSPKVKKGLVNIYHKDKNEDETLIRHNQYHDKEINRLGEANSSIYPRSFSLIIIKGDGNDSKDVQRTVDSAYGQFDNTVVMEENNLGRKILSNNIAFGKNHYVVVAGAGVVFSRDFVKRMKKYVLNPGVIHRLLGSWSVGNDTPELIKRDVNDNKKIFIYNTSANALKGLGEDRLSEIKSVDDILLIWEEKKRVDLTSDVLSSKWIREKSEIINGKKYAIYGAGAFGKKALDLVKKYGAEAVFFIDSDDKKWKEKYHNLDIISPKDAFERRSSYDKVIIGALAYYEIRRNMLSIGFDDDDIICPVYMIEE